MTKRCIQLIQDYAKATEQISTRLGGRMVHEPRQKPLNFCTNSDKGADIGMFLSLSLTL